MWEQGQHVAIVGQTGSGKSYLNAAILPYRKHVIMLRTKADDIKYPGFRSIKRVAEIGAMHTRYLLKPAYAEQAEQVHQACELAWKQGGWCIAVDEFFYICDRLKRVSDVERLLTQGRSLHVSVVCGMQRPSRISRFALSEATHVFAFRAEGRDTKVIAEATTPRLLPLFEQLRKHECIYFNRVTGAVEITKAQHIGRLFGHA